MQRLELKRTVVDSVNRVVDQGEQLCGLSVGAIDRWTIANGLSNDSPLFLTITKIASELGFLATRSQQSVDECQERKLDNVASLIDTLHVHLSRYTS